MMFKVVVAALVGYLVQDVACQSRQSITNQYQPSLLRLKTLLDAKYVEVNKEYNTLYNQLKQNDNQTRTLVADQITNIKSVINLAKQQAQNISQVLNCVRQQETTASRLSATPLQVCTNTASYNTSNLVTVKGKYPKLAAVAANTVTYCQNLNPVDTQDESYEECLSNKVVDLSRQVVIVENEYDTSSNETLDVNVRCLMSNSAVVFGQIGSISYELNLCVFRV